MLENKKELKEYQDKLMQGAKGTMALGTLSTIGTYAFARVGSNHPTTAPAANAAVSGLQLANVGNLAAVGMSIVPGANKKTKKSDIKDERLKRMLG